MGSRDAYRTVLRDRCPGGGAVFECARRHSLCRGAWATGNYEITSEMTPGYEMSVAAADMLVSKLSGDAPR